MELLGIVESHAVRLWLAQSTVVFFIIAGITLLVIGISLLVNSAATLQFFGRMNRWVSMRHASRPLEIPHDTRLAVQKYRYSLAAVFVVGGIFAVFGLLNGIDTRGVIRVFGLEFMRPTVAEWLVDSVRWILVTGNLVGILVGILLAFFPQTVVKLEARGSRWFSERKATKGADTLNLGLDAWVVTNPRPAGWGIVVFALAMIGAFGMILPKVW